MPATNTSTNRLDAAAMDHYARIRLAQELLETTNLSIDRIALKTGFDSPVTFRKRFQRVVGVNPSHYRRQFSRRQFSRNS